jgi:hypothetical protein
LKLLLTHIEVGKMPKCAGKCWKVLPLQVSPLLVETNAESSGKGWKVLNTNEIKHPVMLQVT